MRSLSACAAPGPLALRLAACAVLACAVLACAVLACALLDPSRVAAQGAHTGGAHTGGGSHTGGSHTGGAHGDGARGATSPRDELGEAYAAASRAWHEGRYDDALSRFRALYRSSARHELLFDIGVTADRLGRLEEAIEAFDGYLAHVPAATNRAEVEQRIASLREDLRERDAIVTSPPPPRATQPRSERPLMRLQGPPASTLAPATASTTGAIARSSTPPPQEEIVVTGGGPEWIATWPLLVLTLGAGIAAPIAWDQGWQSLALLHARCADQGGCTEDEIASSDPQSWQLATNVLLVSTIVLGATTLIVFLAEGLSGSPTVTRRAVRDDVELRVGLGGLGLEGSF